MQCVHIYLCITLQKKISLRLYCDLKLHNILVYAFETFNVMLYIHECTNRLFGHFMTTEQHCMLISCFFSLFDEAIYVLYIHVKLKSVRREHGKTAVRTGKFVLLTYSLTTSHKTTVHCCSTEAHLAPVPFCARLTCAWH